LVPPLPTSPFIDPEESITNISAAGGSSPLWPNASLDLGGEQDGSGRQQVGGGQAKARVDGASQRLVAVNDGTLAMREQLTDLR
jgi:hypothetical protein